MKLFNSIGPNSHVVRMFAAEKAIKLEIQAIDIVNGENRQSWYLEKNPAGGAPCLELNSGVCISEITAICEYLEDRFPAKPLIGTTAEQKAEARMWARRVDLNICEPIANGYRLSYPGSPIPGAADGLKRMAQEKITWLNGLMARKDFICGGRLTLADIMLFAFIRFGKDVGQPLNNSNAHIVAWYDRMGARPSSRV